MADQLELGLLEPIASEEDPRCGTCVTWNAATGALIGGCAVANAIRSADAAACPWWFPRHELRRALYGKSAP